MSESKPLALPLRLALSAAAGLGLLAWLVLGAPDRRDAARSPGDGAPTATPAPDVTGPSAASARPIELGSVAEGGRITLGLAALPAGRPALLRLELPDEFRFAGAHGVRIVSAEGTRIDTTATPRPGVGSGLELAIDPGALAPGLYMVEVDVGGTGPRPIRRYVIEVPR